MAYPKFCFILSYFYANLQQKCKTPHELTAKEQFIYSIFTLLAYFPQKTSLISIITIIFALHYKRISIIMEENKDIRCYNRIKVVLAEQMRTNKWLAEQLGKDPATVSKWCTNSSQPGIELLFKIAEVLKVDAKDLLWSTKGYVNRK